MQIPNSPTEPTPAETECRQESLKFPDLISRPVVVEANADHVSSDGGSVLLATMDRSFGFTQRFARCFRDERHPDWIEHKLLTMLRQRSYGIALGYEDLNDHDQLRLDPLIAAACGRDDVEGAERWRDQGKPLAGKSPLNRLELRPRGEKDFKYKRIEARGEAIEDFFIQEYVRTLKQGTGRVVLDLDLTADPLYGEQEGRFFHGYYDDYCYLPLYIFAGDWPVVARLRTADQDHFEDTMRVVAKVVAAIRRKFPRMKIVLRGDSGFCRDELMAWCEQDRVQYVFGLGGNAVLKRILRGSLRAAQSMLDYHHSQSERRYKDFRYRAKSWAKRKRRVVGKAEWTTQGANPRFVITSIPASEVPAPALYEQEYCGRGNMENRIKEQHLDLFADRTSTHSLQSNQLRLWFSTLAYLMMTSLRRWGLAGTELAQATCATIRLKLFKVGAIVKVSYRRVLVLLSESYPLKDLWFKVGAKLLCASGP